MEYLKNKKAQFLARDYVIAIILFSGVMALMVLMIAGTADTYNNNAIIDPNIEENYADLSETTAIASSAFDATSENEGLTFFGAFDTIFNSAFTVISLIFSSVGIAGSAMSNIALDLGIPTAVANIFFPMMLAILMVIIVFVILSTTTRRDF